MSKICSAPNTSMLEVQNSFNIKHCMSKIIQKFRIEMSSSSRTIAQDDPTFNVTPLVMTTADGLNYAN
jgi:hypothetical protein